MPLTSILVTAGTAVTNPNPNTLGTINPFPSTVSSGTVNLNPVSAAWAAQAALALWAVKGETSIPVEFIPSVAVATYTVTMWRYNRTANAWVQPKDNASFTITGSNFTYISTPGEDPIWLQLSNISSGTVAIYFDNGLARAQ